MGSADFCQLGRNGLMVDWQAPKTGERPCSLFHVVLLDQIARRFGENKQAEEEDKRPCQLNRNGDTVTPRVVSVRSGVVHNGGEEQPDGDSPLVSTDNKPADPVGSRLGLVQRNWANAVSK